MKKLGFFLLFSALAQAGMAQSDMSLYNFNAIGQSLYTNPAMPQQSKLWIGLPAMSGMSFSYHNSAFSLVDVAATGTDVNANIETVILGLDDRSHLSAYSTIDLLGFGVKTGNGFVSLGAQQIIDLKVDFNADLFKFLWFGNGSEYGRNVDISGFDAEFVQRTAYYAGYQHTLMDDKLTIGGRGKFLVGQQHWNVDRMNINIRTSDSSSLHATSDIRVRTAGLATVIDGEEFGVFNKLAFPQNRGFALDLGAYYKLSEKWHFSASLLDLGYIRWQDDTRDYVSEGSFDYHGMDADLQNDPPIESQDEVLDSLKEAFNFEELDGQSYKRSLSSRFFAAADYNFNKKHSLGGIYHMRLWEDQAYHDFSVNYRGRVSRWFQFIVNYSVINGTFDNLGGGFDLKAGPVQLYVLSDNVLGGIFYENLQSTSVRVGLNIALYGKKDRDKTDEEPAAPPVPQPEPEDKS